jgi:hypothetical protein
MVLMACASMPAEGQPGCDNLHTATFSQTDLGGYLHVFTPDLPDDTSSIISTEWGFLGEDFTQFSLSPEPQILFPGMGDYLVCLRAGVLVGQQAYCISLHCELVGIPADSACAGLQPAFSITPQGSEGLLFGDQTSSDQPVLSHTWDFGDGSTSTETSPVHQYAGAGPYQACLTTSTMSCTASVCNWIYLGPADVPCDTLLHAAIGVIQYERTIAAFDQSVTSGMNSSVHWDFGDGATDSGSPAIHTYTADGYYTVCGTVSLWGPLTPDTCTTSVCQAIYTIQTSAGIALDDTGPGLLPHPLPFSSALTVEGAPPKARWELLDLLGRVRYTGVVPAGGRLMIQGEELEAGSYFVRIHSRTGINVLRVVKN